MAGRSRKTPARAGAALFAALLLAHCAPAPEETGPPGLWWAGRTPAVRALLAELSAFEGTPLGQSALQLAALLPSCDRVGAHVPEGDFAQLVVETRCLAPDSELERAWQRSEAEIAFALPGAPSARLHGALRYEADALVADLVWPQPEVEGALTLLLPGDDPAGADRLASAGRLIHARVRPRDGIDLAALVPADSQADRLFRLRSAVLAGAVLDGTWEAAVYLPERADGMPGVALALGFRIQRAAVAAAESLIADLQETWDVQRVDHELPAGAGACLPDLNLLPDFAPCYVATEDTLVVGWNPASLERALGGAGQSPQAATDSAARLDIDLALIHRADALIAAQTVQSKSQGEGPHQQPLRWPWRRLRAVAATRDDALAVRLVLALPQQAAR